MRYDSFGVWVWCCTLAVMLGVVRANDESDAPAADHRLVFRVVENEAGAAIADATIHLQMWGSGVRVTKVLQTDIDGVATFDYPDHDGTFRLRIGISHSGHVASHIEVGTLERELLPREKIVRLKRGQTIGGQVVDPQGQPVVGARVSISDKAPDATYEIYYDLFEVRTDELGRWHTDGAPLETAGRSLEIEHPDFLEANVPVQFSRKGRYVLDPGLMLRGRVTDAQGQPIAKARVTFGRDRFGSRFRPVETGPQGEYVFRALPEGSTFVTAEAPGHGPAMLTCTPGDGRESVDLKLPTGRTIRLELREHETNRPAANVRVLADTWQTPGRHLRTLWWEGHTNEHGVVEWTGAPNDPVEFHVLGANYAALRDVVVAPQDEPHVVTMFRSMTVTGLVTDAQKQVIPRFRVETGVRYGSDPTIHWNDYTRTDGGDGRFEVKQTEFSETVVVRISAEGYEPWVSPELSMRTSEHKLFVRLKANAEVMP